MNLKSPAWLSAGILAATGLSAVAVPTAALASATLQIVQGSGEFQSLETAITVAAAQPVTLQWTTDQTLATGGRWQVLNGANAVVATGDATPAPAVGHFLRFTLPAGTFLKTPGPATATPYKISIQPHNASNQNLGAPSPAVTVTQIPSATQPPIVFGPSAKFPKVEIVTYDEKVGVVPQTQIHYAYADVTLRIRNTGATATDPAWLGLKDQNVLMRQSPAQVSIPSLQPGASQLVTVRLDAVLPPATSQLPQDQQYSQWNQQYRDRCGVDLRSVLDWRGPAAQTPIGSHLENLVVKEGWSDYAKVPPNTPICNGTQCVSTCQIEKNIRKQLDGHVTGYSFFVGQYPRWGDGGQARTLADAPAQDFTSSTKITVASVSKLVTTIAAVRLLDQKGVSLDAAIGPYLPSDWKPSDYVKKLTFAQLLGQRSGIKDYGNVTQDYNKLKSFFTQSVSTNSMTTCQNSDVIDPPNAINPNNTGWCYSNYNFAIMRILLPKVAGYAEDANLGTRPATLANQYVQIVQQQVFNRVGQYGVACKPPTTQPGASTYAYAYKGPNNQAGTDFGDVSSICGAAGWYLSVEDMSKVLLSLNAKDGKILPATPGHDLWETMRTRALGWDVVRNDELEKNGGWGANCDGNKVCDNITTSVAIFGPVTGPRVPAVLFINSNIVGGPASGGGAKGVLEQAYKDALYTKP